MDEKFRRDDRGREKTCGGIEKFDAGLLSNICEMSEVPGHEIVDLMDRRECDVESVGHELSMKDPA